MQSEVSADAHTNGDPVSAGLVATKPPTEETRKDNSEKFSSSAPKKEGDAYAKLLEAIQDCRDEFLRSLTTQPRSNWLWRKLSNASHPELLQVYGIIYNHLGEAQRLLMLRAADPTRDVEGVEQHLRVLLGKCHVHATNVHAAWALAGSLERTLMLLGDDNYVITRLVCEREREQKKLPGSWSEYLAVEALDDLLEKYKPRDDTGQRARAVESLVFLYEKRSGYMRTLRAGEEMKADYLNRLTYVLALLLFLLLEAMYIAAHEGRVTFRFGFDFADKHIHHAIVAAMTGAIGSTLSGFYKLRDATGGVAALRAFRSAMWAQPFVGATVGVLLMLLITSGILAVGSTGPSPNLSWLPLAVYCFVAGFSEPFFLGVVQRVAGAADKKTQGAAEGGTEGAAVRKDEVKK